MFLSDDSFGMVLINDYYDDTVIDNFVCWS